MRTGTSPPPPRPNQPLREKQSPIHRRRSRTGPRRRRPAGPTALGLWVGTVPSRSGSDRTTDHPRRSLRSISNNAAASHAAGWSAHHYASLMRTTIIAVCSYKSAATPEHKQTRADVCLSSTPPVSAAASQCQWGTCSASTAAFFYRFVYHQSLPHQATVRGAALLILVAQ